jgi:hypothetical protein
MSMSLLAAVSLFGGRSASGQEKPAQSPRYASMPWHLVDVWWDIGKDVPFQSYSIDVTIGDEIPSSANLYIAPIGLGHFGKTPFDGGILTQVDGHTKKDPEIRKLGGDLISLVAIDRRFSEGSWAMPGRPQRFDRPFEVISLDEQIVRVDSRDRASPGDHPSSPTREGPPSGPACR